MYRLLTVVLTQKAVIGEAVHAAKHVHVIIKQVMQVLHHHHNAKEPKVVVTGPMVLGVILVREVILMCINADIIRKFFAIIRDTSEYPVMLTIPGHSVDRNIRFIIQPLPVEDLPVVLLFSFAKRKNAADCIT